MTRDSLVDELYGALQFIQCNICPLRKACDLYETAAGGDNLCDMLLNEIDERS